MGERRPTGKTWLYNKLKEHGFNAFELTESTFDLIDYRDEENHVIGEEFGETIVIVLNKPLRKGE
jgi:predicted transcriptional regulator